MLPTLSVLSWALLHAVSVQPTTVPAHGEQEVTVHVDAPGMVKLEVLGGRGTACTLVDQLRGPFEQAGNVGKAACVMMPLLDASTYKLRLKSPVGQKGSLTVRATPFVEKNAQRMRLALHRTFEGSLPVGQQSSSWIHLDVPGYVTLRVAGRTAGLAKLWRSGQWLGTESFHSSIRFPLPGRGIHESWLEQKLQAGDYLVVAYGVSPVAWTQGGDDDTVTMALGFERAPEGHAMEVKIGVSGLTAVALPASRVQQVLFAQRLEGDGVTEVTGIALPENAPTNVEAVEGSCRIEPKALDPSCVFFASGTGPRGVLVRGKPGTQVSLQWQSYAQDQNFTLNGYGAASSDPWFFVQQSGDYFLGTHELPLASDEEPLACALAAGPTDARHIVAWDTLKVSAARPFARSFNYDGRSAAIWFEVTAADSYQLIADGQRKDRCELFRQGNDGKREHVGGSGDTTGCHLDKLLTPGHYALELFGGVAGIEHLQIAKSGGGKLADTSTHMGCELGVFPLAGSRGYALLISRHDGVVTRGLIGRPTPVRLDDALPLAIEGHASLRLPVLATGSALEVRSGSGRRFTCSLGGARTESRDGACRLAVAANGNGHAQELGIENPEAEPLAVSVSTPRPLAPPSPLDEYAPHVTPPPSLAALGKSLYVDFGRESEHAFVFDVARAGLYEAGTEGLLATRCSLRSPVIPSIPGETSGGRGRNCRVSSFLRPGRYLFSAATLDASEGRAGVVLRALTTRELPALDVSGDVFADVNAGQLITERVSVATPGLYTLSTRGQNARLLCRLEDDAGWPLESVPTPCEGAHRLRTGSYRWLQLPITVESTRHTHLERLVGAKLLRGGGPFPLVLNTPYPVQLARGGTDRFTFSLSTPQDLRIRLDHGMQGRLFQTGPAGSKTLLELIPPAPETAAPPAAVAEQEPPESEEGDGGADPDAVATPTVAETPTPGRWLQLAAGTYALETQHSRGDVAIHYAVRLESDVLSPGVTRSLGAPGQFPVRVPADGMVRIVTRGETAVRCRLLNAWGSRVAESARRDADWNCSLTQPLSKGDYTLVLEDELLSPGPTEVSMTTPTLRGLGTLPGESSVALGAEILAWEVPVATGDGVQDVELTAAAPMSCALLTADGRTLDLQLDTKACSLLWRPTAGEHDSVRIWASGTAMKAAAGYRFRPFVRGGGQVAPETSVIAGVPHGGSYRTGKGVVCLGEAERGLLRPCGPIASLEAGTHVFAGVLPRRAELGLREVLSESAAPRALWLSRSETLEVAHRREPSLHLLSVLAPHGEPRCRLEPGVRALGDGRCDAAAVGLDVLGRWSATEELQGEVQRASIPLGRLPALTLVAGLQSLRWEGPDVRLVAISPHTRLELTLAADAWAVQLDGNQKAVEVCPPGGGLSHCSVVLSEGSVVVHSPRESRADAVALSGVVEAVTRTLGTLFEVEAHHGSDEAPLDFSAAKAERVLSVSGHVGCKVSLEDGTRRRSCEQNIPAGVGGRLVLEHGEGPLRVLLAARSVLTDVGFARVPGKGAAPVQRTGAEFALQGAAMEREIVLSHPAVLHVHSDRGVCGVFQGAKLVATQGLDAGCELYRTAAAGSYRLVIRGFAGATLSGQARYTEEPLLPLGEGVAAEVWLRPGEQRSFHFDVPTAGDVGLGVRVPKDVLVCSVSEAGGRVLGTGCQQLLTLPAGGYQLDVKAADAMATAVPFRPVLLGLTAPRSTIPPEYLQDLFTRIGAQP